MILWTFLIKRIVLTRKNLRDCYYSAQLKNVILWCDSRYEAKWGDMERECRGIPIQAMIGDYKLMMANQEHLNPLISFALCTWFAVLKKLKLWNQLKKFRWIKYDTDFKPNGRDSIFKFWTNKGILIYPNVMEKSALQSFRELRGKYNLEKHDFSQIFTVTTVFFERNSDKGNYGD